MADDGGGDMRSARSGARAAVSADGYGEVLERLKTEVRAARLNAQRTVNSALLELFWTIGTEIRQQQAVRGWGAKVIDQLARDLRAEFPNLRGMTRSNLYYMRAFATSWPERAIVPTLMGRLSWSHVRCLLDKLDDPPERDWYAGQAGEHGWTLTVLEHQIAADLRARIASAPSNFAGGSAAVASAQQLTKDPYVFEFLSVSDQQLERDLEQALMDRLQETLLEFGRGFAFVGRQVHFDVGGEDFYADLVLFHVEQLRYVVVELKIGRFKPDYTGQLGFYVAAVDDQLRRSDIHQPTVGILLCASRNDAVVRYALANTSAPMAVANYTADAVQQATSLNLPSPAEFAAILDAPVPGRPGITLADELPDDDTGSA